MRKASRGKSARVARNRRRMERLSIEVPISVTAARGRAAFREHTKTVDLSQGGASFRGRKSYRPGMQLKLEFLDKPKATQEGKAIKAEVVRVTSPQTGEGLKVGVRFGGTSLANLILFELLRSKIRTSWALLEIIQALSPGLQIEDVIQAICRAVEKAMESERALLFMRDADQGVLRARLEANGRSEEYSIGLGEGIVGRAAEADKTTHVHLLAGDPRLPPDLEKYFDAKTRSVLCAPLKKEHGVSPGLLVVANKRYGSFTREDEQLGAAVADEIAVVLREARLFEDLRNVKRYNEGILESIASGVLGFDRSGNLVMVNRAATDLVGAQAGALLGNHYSGILGSTANPRLCAVMEEVLARQRRRTAYDVRFVRSDGTSFSLNLHAFPLKDAKGNLSGAVLVTQDITHEQRLMSTLTRYVAREVAEQVLQDQGALKLGGTRTEVTILLADIRNFTSITEQMDPEDVVNLLNTYYPRIINVIFRHHGMLDKFIGDAILAVFGVPARRPDDALRAVRAALDIRKEVRAVNRDRGRRNQVEIEMGMGITSGTVISGNIGSERRMDYTVIGDPVNLASRLEGLTKELQHKILISDSVRAAVEKEIAYQPLGLFKVRGKQEEIPVFAVKSPD